MTISIGTSSDPTVRETHIAWLRLREGDRRHAAETGVDRGGPDRETVPAGRDPGVRMIPDEAVDVPL